MKKKMNKCSQFQAAYEMTYSCWRNIRWTDITTRWI